MFRVKEFDMFRDKESSMEMFIIHGVEEIIFERHLNTEVGQEHEPFMKIQH